MKKIKLFGKFLTYMITNHTFFTVWLVLLQIIIAFSYIFFYATLPNATISLTSSLTAVRTLDFSLITPNMDYTYEELTELVSDNGIAIPEDFVFFYALDEKTKFIAYGKPEMYSPYIVDGIGITAENINNKDCVAIVGTNGTGETDFYESETKPGDTIIINDTDFKVIAIESRSADYIEIPYSVGFEKYPLTSFSVRLPEGLSDGQLSEVKQYVEGKLGGIIAQKTLTINEMVTFKLQAIILASVFVAIIALLNLCFMYRYIISEMKGYFSILRLCGANARSLILSIYTVYLTIYLASFTIGMIMFSVVKQYSGLVIFESSVVGFYEIAAVFAAFFVIISLLILPVIKMVHKPIKEAGLFL